MRKILLGTSAIALAGAMSAPAQAAEWDVAWGGFMEAWVGYGTTDFSQPTAPGAAAPDFDGVATWADGEIIFKPSITLDNGIKFGAVVELESRQGGDQIDEQYVFVRGSFGEIIIGDENSAGYKMTYAAPDVSFFGVNSGSTSNFVVFPGANDVFRGTLGATFVEVGGNNDAGRITYFTPRFAGFQLGVSYARDGQQDSTGLRNIGGNGTLHDIVDFGANYVNSFGGFDVAISGRYGFGTVDGFTTAAVAGTNTVSISGGGVITQTPNGGAAPAGDTVLVQGTVPVAASTTGGTTPTVWAAGINLGFGGFTIGGSFAESNDSGNSDGIGYDAGVSYRTGPWGFSFTYFHGENVDDEIGFAGALNNDEELDQYLLAIDYDLAKGVDLNLVAGYAEFDEETTSAGTVVGGDDTEGFFIGTGLRLRF